MPRTISTTARSSSICARPSRSTMRSADSPEANIFSNTCLAVGPLIAPLSTSLIRPASAAGDTGTRSMPSDAAFISRISSPMIQLLAALGLPASRAAASK
jgi:hypothetical protein